MSRSDRKLPVSSLALSLLLAAVMSPAGSALALERGGYSMEILVGGTPLHEYAARGSNYVEALKNREYSVRLRNGSAERVAIAVSVDGLNSIDAGTTSALEARKWVLGPYETITLDGWQTTSTTARRFFFTTEERSYGEWLGRTKNLGIVAAAVFRERRPLPMVSQGWERRDGSAGDSKEAPGAGRSRMGGMPESRVGPERPGDLAATGIGQETSHPVREVAFDSEDSPSAVLEVRYEYRDALVRLGVVPANDRCEGSLARRERARGFEETGFAKDPYRRRNR